MQFMNYRHQSKVTMVLLPTEVLPISLAHYSALFQASAFQRNIELRLFSHFTFRHTSFALQALWF